MMKASLVQQTKKKRPYKRNKDGLTQRRVTCTVCLKPGAVWYYADKKQNNIIYEHRDEPPVREYYYKNEKTKRKTYRRCHTGVSKENPMDAILKNTQEEAQQQQQEQVHQIEEPDWKKMYFEMKTKYDVAKRFIRGANDVLE